MNAFTNLTKPHLHDGSLKPLQPNSILADLPLYECQWELESHTRDLAQLFDQMPTLPGIILTDAGEFVGVISRARFGEYLLRPQGHELFLPHPLRVLHSYARTQPLCLTANTTILNAAHQALRRSPELVGEPILIQQPNQPYQLLDFHDLNIAAWQIRGIETQVWYESTHLEILRHKRMASLGRLVDGVSHEILDPVGLIWGNLKHLTHYVSDLLDLISRYEATYPDIPPELIAYRHEIEVEYLREDVPRTLASLKTGANRLSQLATSLQIFCHIR